MTTEPEISIPEVMRNWGGYCAAIAVHAAMEDGVEGAGGGSAAMLDYYFDGAHELCAASVLNGITALVIVGDLTYFGEAFLRDVLPASGIQGMLVPDGLEHQPRIG